MLIRVGFDLAFETESPVPMQVLMRLHQSRLDSLRSVENVVIEPRPVRRNAVFVDSYGNRGEQIVSPTGLFRIASDLVVHDDGEPDPCVPDAAQVPIEQLMPDEVSFLLPSRYCEVDLLGDVAWDLFGSVAPGWPRVQAVCDWVHERLTYGYEFANASATAVDVMEQRTGVCRDFTHLAVTLCRCLNIPARYVAGWLGDIGIAPIHTAMDFHAWFEARLEGGWYTFDARHNTPRIGRVAMARGRDATDVALTTSFGPAPLRSFEVWASEVDASEVDVSEAGAPAIDRAVTEGVD